jgi:hypothetical protein
MEVGDNQHRGQLTKPLITSPNFFEMQLLATKQNHRLYSRSTVENIKKFLSKLSSEFSNKSSFIYTKPLT